MNLITIKTFSYRKSGKNYNQPNNKNKVPSDPKSQNKLCLDSFAIFESGL